MVTDLRPSADELDDAFASVAARRAGDEADASARAELWHAHHWPHRYERCMVVGGRHVCRRCVWFYGVAFTVMAMSLAGLGPWPTAWDAVLLWTLPIAATVDFVAGELGRLAYDPRRQIVVTVLMGLAVGRGFAAELTARWSWTFWGPCLVFGSIWLAAGLQGRRRGTGQYADPDSGEGALDA